MTPLRIGGLIGRFAASLAVVLATYNPSGRCYVNWVTATFPHVAPLQAVAGLLLLVAWLFLVHATWRSLGALGVVLGLAFFGALVWLMVSFGWVSLSNHGVMVWIVEIIIACLLSIGLSWVLPKLRVKRRAVVEEAPRR